MSSPVCIFRKRMCVQLLSKLLSVVTDGQKVSERLSIAAIVVTNKNIDLHRSLK